MQNRRRVVASVAVVAAAAITAGGVAGLALSGASVSSDPSHSSTAGRQAGAPNAPTGSASDHATGRPGTNDEPGESAPSASDPSASASPGSGATRSTRGGVETVPDTPGTTPSSLVDLAKPTESSLPSWDDLPDQPVSARGRLVPGYPASLLPATPRALVVTSSLSPSPGRVQLALVARRDQSPKAVLKFYRARLTRAGFVEKAVPAAAGATSAAFVRAANRVVVTVDPGGAQTYSVWATLATGEA